MTDFLKKIFSNRICISCFFIICGLFCIILPKVILPTISLIVGILFFIYALYQLVMILEVKNNTYLGFSILSCALSFIFSLIFVLNQDAGTIMVGLLVGILTATLGTLHLLQSIMLYKLKMPYFSMVAKCVLEYIIAILMFTNMAVMVELQIILLGIAFAIYGIYTLCLYLIAYKEAQNLKNSFTTLEEHKQDDNTIEIIIEDDKE